MKTSLFRRLSSFLTATALAVTSFVPQISASAITDGNLSMVEKVAHLDYTTTLANGYDGDYFKEHGLNPNYLTVDGKEVFCIQPFTFFGDMQGDSLNYVIATGTNDYWNGRSQTDDRGYNLALTPEKRSAIGLVMYYGYYNGNKSHQTNAYRLATQLLIWEVSGFNKYYTGPDTVRDPSSFNINSGKKSTLNEVELEENAGCTKKELTDAYNQIVTDIRNRGAIGSMSYTSERYAKNNVKDLKWNAATNRYEYKFALNAADAALWEDLGWTQKINADSLLSVSKSGNTYTVYTKTPFATAKTFSSIKSSTNAPMYRNAKGITIYHENSQPNEKQVVAMGGTPQPVTGYMAFRVLEVKGEINIQKEFNLSDGTEAPDSFYEQVSFKIKNSSGHYLTLTQENTANGTYSYKGTASSASEATTIKLGTKSKTAKIINLSEGNYTVEEVLSGDIFRVTAAQQSATIGAAATVTVSFENTEMSGDLEITKTDDNGNVLSGIRFNVTGTSDSGRQVYLSGVTDAAGKLTFENIPVGTYTVIEDKKSVPAGYFTADNQTVVITANDTTKIGVINDEKKGTINVHKTAEDDIVEGIEIKISWTEDGEAKSATQFTDANGWAEFAELKVYDTDNKTKIAYTAEELNTDDKYVVPEAVTVTLPDNGDDRDISATAELNNKLKKFYLEIVKTEPGTGAAIPGAVYGLYKDDVLLDEYTTDADGKIVTKDYTCDDGIFYFKELSAPAGYTIDDSKHFVDANAASYTVERTKISAEVNDKPTEFSVSKQTVYGKELEGAEMQIIDADGKIVDEWISESTPHIVSNLAAGDYILKEAAAPDGYVIATDISFSIDNRNKVTVNGVEATAKDDQGNPTLTLIDETTKVEISKQSVTGDGELPGAKLQVIDENGSVVDEWISTNEPHYIEAKLSAGKTYTLHEEIAPEGYLIANDITFTVSEDGTVTEVVMIDDIMTGSIEVSKKTEGQLNVEGIDMILSGTSFVGLEVNVIATTDANGKAVFEYVPIGSYTITEDGATVPTGYLTADPVEGVEVVYAEATDVEIYNAEATGSISVQKKTEGMLNLGGIDFILSGMTVTGREIKLTATTDENGLAVFESVPIGSYTITEDGATVPTGYLTADPVEGVEVVYAEATDVEIYNAEATGSIQIHKKTKGMKDLGGISFVLSGVSTTGRTIELTATTDENGKAVFEFVPIGSYTITEDGATVPAGYLTADPVEGVEVIYAEQTDVIITNEKIPDNPVTGEETPFVCTMCILSILAVAVIGRRLKRSEDR